jgi:hypothetical protein
MEKYYTNINRMVAKILTICMMCVVSLQAVAQQYYPVVARFTQLPPYPVYLADFSNPAQTNLSIQIQQNDRTIATRPIRIRVHIEGQGGLQIQSVDVVQDEPSLVLNYGQVYNLPSNQVANYFKQYNLKVSPAQYREPFNEGLFRFGVEIIDVQTSRAISGIQWGTAVWIAINEPPVWVLPKNELVEKPMVPQNINFQWAPRHNKISNVEYEFSMTEIITNNGAVGNVQNLFLSQPTFYKTRTQGTTLNFNATMPPLVPGRTYAYRVQAIAKRGFEDVGVFRNNGYSEVQYFKYGEPVPDLKPPTNLKLTWADNNKGANFNWKGEAEHKSFVVEVREKGQKGDWISSTPPAQPGSVLNAMALSNLDPNKSYEVRVTGLDDKGRKATSILADLSASPIPPKIENLNFKGKVLWAYYAAEESMKDSPQTASFWEKGRNYFKERQTQNYPLSDFTPGTKKYPLEGAVITLYRTDQEDVTIDNFKLLETQKIIFRVTTATTNAAGEYTLNGQGLKLLAGAKSLYAVAEYKGIVFRPALVKLEKIANDAAGTIEIKELIELANTIRYLPKLNTKDKKKNSDFEEVGLYRLKSTISQYKYLANEGTLTGQRDTIKYNNDIYVKVFDFGKSDIANQIFYNKPYNDKFVLRVKEKTRRQVVFPINDIEDTQDGKGIQIIDYFDYTTPNNNHLISGILSRKIGPGIPNELVKNAQIRVFGNSVRTNNNGYYEIEMPLSTTANAKIYLSAVDPLNTNIILKDSIIYQSKDETKNFVLNSVDHYLSGQVRGQDGRIISGATIEYQKQKFVTDSKGYFKIAGTGELMQSSLKITFDGYEPLEAKAEQFKKYSLDAFADANKRKSEFTFSIPKEKKDESADYENFYEQKYTKDVTLATIYQVDSLILLKGMYYRIVAYTDNGPFAKIDSVISVDAKLNVDGKPQNVNGKLLSKAREPEKWAGGYVNKTFSNKLKIKVLKMLEDANNPNSTKYLEEDLELNMPTKYTKDTVVLKVRLRPVMYFYGTVYDSTTFIKGVHDIKDTLTRTVNGVKRRLLRLPGEKFYPADSVQVSVNGSKAVTTADGYFKVLVPRGEEFQIELSKNGFATSKYAISPLMAKRHSKAPDSTDLAKDRKDLYLLQQDQKIPTFKTLLGFTIKVDKVTKQSSTAFLLSGVLYLDQGKLDSKLRDDNTALKDLKTNIFTAGGTTSLNFKDIVVMKDTKTETNAITVAKSINFVETEAKILLFGYAPITLQGNPTGEPYIRLAHLDVKAGAAVSEGKIGASKMAFTQQTMMGINFGKMTLTVKDPEKEAKFGKFDDKVSDKDGTKKEKEYKLDQAKIATSVALANTKEAADNAASKTAQAKAKLGLQNAEIAQKKAEAATKDDKKADEKKDKEKLEKETKKLEKDLPSLEKEPLLIAFSPSNLEELADTKEFTIGFSGALKKGDEKDLTAAKAPEPKEGEAKKEDKYKDYLKFSLGNAGPKQIPVSGSQVAQATGTSGLVGLGVGLEALKNSVMAGIDPESPTLKKSGISMKGIILMPEIWRFTSNEKPMTIEKLEIDKKFGMKTVIIGKSDPDKKEIVAFGVASSWMCYINTVQIYNDFKGYGIGGTFNTDQTNYININSLGLSVVDGRVYPNVDLSTPEEGFKVSKLRFKTIGKKNITIKGNPADKSYEVEGSLRVEYDANAAVNSKTDSTNRFGKALSPSETYANRAKAKEEADAAAKQANLAANREKGEKAIMELIKEAELMVIYYQREIDGSKKAILKHTKIKDEYVNSSKAKVSTKDISRQNELIKDAENELTKETRLKKAEETKLAKLYENLRKVTELRVADIAAGAKKREEEGKKKEEEDKKKAEKEAKVISDEGKKAAIADGKAYVDPNAKNNSKSKTWQERVFPIEVQYFKWSSTGKWTVSASPSQDALNFGPVNIKIRRLVFAKGIKGSPIKESEVQDLLKMTEDEMKKLNSTAKFNDANTLIDKDGKRSGATSKESITSKAGASVDGINIKGIEDKVAAENPLSSAWAFGFAGGIEVQTKSVNVDSDATLYVGDFDGKGVVFKLNEIMIKVDATSFRAYAKVKIATSGKKIGFEGEGEFEGAKLKAAMSLKFYKLYDDNGNGTGIELGAALKVSTGVTGVPMPPITWTALGGGFDLNTADKKFSIFFLGDAILTGTTAKVTEFKKIKISLDFEGKECGLIPILRGSMEWWTGVKSADTEKLCDVKAEIDLCRLRVVVTLDCEMIIRGDTKANVNALVFMSKSAGIFMGAKVRMNLFDASINGSFMLGILCDTQDPKAPMQLASYVSDIPRYLFQSDGRTISAIYLSLDASFEKKGGGGASAFGINLVTYSYAISISGKCKLGLNFSNGNFDILLASRFSAKGDANILGFKMGGELTLALELGGGYLQEKGWNIRGSAYGKLMLGAGAYQTQPCNDYSITGILWCSYCTTCCKGTSWRCWKRISIPYPCGGRDRFVKLCLEGGLGFSYQQKGPKEIVGWKGYIGGGAPK